MSTLKLAGSNDIEISDNTLKIITDIEEIAQLLKTRLKLYRGEWFLNTTVGVPWLQEILGKVNTKNGIESIIKDEILKTPGVKSLEAFELDIDASERLLTVTFKVNTESGILDIEVTI